MQLQSDYFTAYHNLKLTRDDKGVLVAEFHINGGPFIMSAQNCRSKRSMRSMTYEHAFFRATQKSPHSPSTIIQRFSGRSGRLLRDLSDNCAELEAGSAVSALSSAPQRS